MGADDDAHEPPESEPSPFVDPLPDKPDVQIENIIEESDNSDPIWITADDE